MNRLAAMQDWPLLRQRAMAATSAARSRSADGMHDERVAATELEHRLLHLVPGDGGHRRAGRARSGQGDRHHPASRMTRLDLRRPDQQGLERPVGEAGPAEQLLDVAAPSGGRWRRA